MSLSERRHHLQRMKAWALKQAKHEIWRYKDFMHHIADGPLKRHLTVESWIKRADHPQSKAKRDKSQVAKERKKRPLNE